MNNVFVYCELEGTTVADVSLELLTKGRKLANQLNCQLEAIVAGNGLEGIEKQVLPFGVDKVHVFDAPGLFPYTSLPHASILINLFKEEKPQICLMGATVIGLGSPCLFRTDQWSDSRLYFVGNRFTRRQESW